MVTQGVVVLKNRQLAVFFINVQVPVGTMRLL